VDRLAKAYRAEQFKKSKIVIRFLEAKAVELKLSYSYLLGILSKASTMELGVMTFIRLGRIQRGIFESDDDEIVILAKAEMEYWDLAVFEGSLDLKELYVEKDPLDLVSFHSN
jgi:hypothetical protein